MKRCQEVPDSPRPAGRGRPSISVKRQPIDPEEYVPACLSAIYLGFINDARSTDALLEILQADVPLELRASAAAALVKTGETRGLPLVLEILDDKSNPRGLRPLALRALGDATDFMTENLYEISRNEPAGSNRDSAHETLNRIVVENLLSLAILKEEDLYLRSRAALIALGEPAVQFLKPHTSNPDRMAQALARLTIARIKSPEKIEQYEETLRKAVKETVLRQEKWYSVSVDYALAEKGIRNWQPSSEMMTLLSNTLARDLLMEVAAKRTLTPSTDSQDSTEPYPESYGEAAACYAAAARTAIADQSEIKREIRYLIWALGAPNAWRPLRFAMAGLRFNKHAEAKSLLIEYLEHANPRVRREAATALGEVLDAPIAVLEKLAEHDPDSSAQKAAQKALKRIEERAAQEK
ncbi:MAG: hypothetical protein GTN69_05300 [Armatimonadetes bacterium]|nr:hypothetical protein [Armatimonadota bacterium]NIO75299.1 hypothetical protein [Armatimonadota bacterium]NIO95859.1 hypothetical protein [Armatimonadota bacterium]